MHELRTGFALSKRCFQRHCRRGADPKRADEERRASDTGKKTLAFHFTLLPHTMNRAGPLQQFTFARGEPITERALRRTTINHHTLAATKCLASGHSWNKSASVLPIASILRDG
jgi:hypothetical protein